MFVWYNVLSINTIVILSIFNYLRKFDGRVLYPHSWSKGFYDALDKQNFHSSSGNFTIPKLLLEFIFSFSVTGYWFNNICLHQIGKMFWSTWWSLFSSDYYRLLKKIYNLQSLQKNYHLISVNKPLCIRANTDAEPTKPQPIITAFFELITFFFVIISSP